MKKCQRVLRGQESLLIAVSMVVLVVATPAPGQNYQEVDDFGWSRGINYAVPAITDLDGDGLLDLVVGSDLQGLSRWEQSGVHATTFRRVERDFMPSDGSSQWGPLFVDLDGNGKSDLLLGQNASRIRWYEEQSAGMADFSLVRDDLLADNFGTTGRLCFADLDDDGLMDLLVGVSLEKTCRYVQTETNGTAFTRVRDIAYSDPPDSYNHPLLLDIEGDGRWELLSGGQDKRMRLYRQDSGVKDSFILVTDSWSGIIDAENGAPAITDVDGDGLLDLFLGTKGGLVRHYEQPAAGAVDGWLLRNANVLNTWDFGIYNTSAVVDLDGDGRLDIIRSEVPDELGATSLPLQHFRQKSPGSYEVEYLGSFNGIHAGIYSHLTFTDLDANGRLDLILLRLNNQALRFEQRSDAPFAFDLVTNSFLPDVTWVFPPHPSFVDVDGNGRLDLLLANGSGSVDRFEASEGQPWRYRPLTSAWMQTFGAQPTLCFTDLDNDGLLDLIRGSHTGKLTHLEQKTAGSSEFEWIESQLQNIDVRQRSLPMVFDVNRDGRLDIVVADGAGGLSLFIDEGPNAVDAKAPAPTGLHLSAPYPQPASRQLTVTLLGEGAEQVEVTLIDLLGREQARIRTEFYSGNRTLDIPVSSLVPGVYILRAVSGATTVQRAVVVRR